MGSILEIKNLTKTYSGGKRAVDNLNLNVQAGDIYGFIGHNGAGKTTTIRAVVGVMGFDSGDIFIDGHSVKKESVLCKSITAYIPDNPDLYDYLTGIQYLSYIGDMFDVAKLCDKIAIIKGGKLIASGVTEEVRGDKSLESVFLEVAGND